MSCQTVSRDFVPGIFFLFLVLFRLAAVTASAEEPMAIYVAPYYNSNGPVIAVGEHSDGLRADSKTELLETVRTMESDLASLPATTMYVAAVRLYDLGARDEAVLWFYRAQFRARAFGSILEPDAVGGIGDPAFEINAAHQAFFQLAGQPINGYSFCDRDKLIATLGRVVEETGSMPDFGVIYPEVKFASTERWNELIEEVRVGLIAMSRSIDGSWDRIAATRAANGMTETYCR